MKTKLLLSAMLFSVLLFGGSTSALAYTQIKVFRDLQDHKLYPFKKWNTRLLYQGYFKIFHSGRISVEIPGSLAAIDQSTKILNHVLRTRLVFTFIINPDEFAIKHPDVLDDGYKQYYGNTVFIDDDGVLGTGLLAGTGFLCGNINSHFECPERTHIYFDRNTSWYTGLGRPGPTQYDFISTAVHELLHMTGQDHVPDRFCTVDKTSPTMCPFIGMGEAWGRTLETSDIRGMGEMYP